jgi:hypothetical protein
VTGRVATEIQATLTDFLRSIAPADGHGYTTLCAIDPLGKAPLRALSFNHGSVADAEAFVAQHRDARNLYWTVNTVKSRLATKPTKADMLAARAFHVDVDTRDPAALARLRELAPPSLLIDSGGGFQGFWFLSKPVPLDERTTADIEARNRGLIERIPGADGSAWNVDRIMRLPFTTNHPTPTKLKKGRTGPVPATLLAQDRVRYGELSIFPAAAPKHAGRHEAAAGDGEPRLEAYADRSRHLLAAVGWALRRGYAERHVVELYREHPHAKDQADPEEAVRRCVARVRENTPAPDTRTIELRPIAAIVAERREVRWLIRDVIEENVLAVMAGPRGSYKSFLALDWALTVARSQPVVMLSGEGGGLDRRVDAWCRAHDVAPDTLALFALERPLDLSIKAVLANLVAAIEALGVGVPVLIVVDTYSKFRGGVDENDNSEVAAFLSQLSIELRHYFGCTVLLVAHVGHTNQDRARGAYALGADTDCEYVVSVDNHRIVEVTRTRYKDSEPKPPLHFRPEVVDLWRVDADLNRVTSVVLRNAEAPPDRKGVGKTQIKLLEAIEARGPGPWTRAELDDIGEKAGVARQSVASAIPALSSRRLLLDFGDGVYRVWAPGCSQSAEPPKPGRNADSSPDVAPSVSPDQSAEPPKPGRNADSTQGNRRTKRRNVFSVSAVRRSPNTPDDGEGQATTPPNGDPDLEALFE